MDLIERYLMLKDTDLAAAIRCEEKRQQEQLELVASENYTSQAVMAVQGSVLTNKYAEGYPSKRYYGGCECVDLAEELAIRRAEELFGAEHANVQPHSGALANMAVYYAALKPGDRILGMALAHGGHLTHGFPANISGKYYENINYGVNSEGFIDYEEVRKKALQVHPKMIIAGASAYPRVIDFQAFAEIAQECEAYLMVDMAHIAGLVAAKVHPSPVSHAHFVTSTTHKTLGGPRGGLILCQEQFAKKIDSAVFPGLQGGPLYCDQPPFTHVIGTGFRKFPPYDDSDKISVTFTLLIQIRTIHCDREIGYSRPGTGEPQFWLPSISTDQYHPVEKQELSPPLYPSLTPLSCIPPDNNMPQHTITEAQHPVKLTGCLRYSLENNQGVVTLTVVLDFVG